MTKVCKPTRLKWIGRLGLATLCGALVLSGLIGTRLWITLQQIAKPQAILVLDGEDDRVQFAAQLAKQYPELPVWISGACSERTQVKAIFERAQLAPGRVHYDLRAADTVTHFTTLVDDFSRQDIRYLYVITSDYHMARAQTIATLIFGSRGIAIAPVSPNTNNVSLEENWIKVVRDGVRSLVWLGTGFTTGEVDPHLA